MSAWFAFPTTLYGSKQALIAADILKVERWEAVGLIAGLYTWSVENADRNGLLENVSASVLADALGYPKKKAEALVKALAEAGIIEVLGERTILVKDWYEVGGRLSDVREKEAEKKRKQRAASYARLKDVPRDVPVDVPETSRANINNNNNNNNISSDDDMCNGGEAANAHACAREHDPTEQPPEVDAYWADADVAKNATTTQKPAKKAKKPTDAALIAEAIKDYADGDAELEGLLQDWMANRKAKRSPATIRAVQLNLDKLDAIAQESGMPVKAYLRDVIARGWAAFFVIKDGGGVGYRASPRPQEPQSTADFYLQMMQDMD